ncbi:MAG: hypothetical protein JWR90_1450 [Marmoricola sp.]|jgi:hypothetical protein|nr:hypothetical protein [Marmoricola sp.]
MSEHHQPPADHSLKIPHLIFGLLFLGIAAVWALVVTNVVTDDGLTVIAPAILIGAGVIGLAASLASGRNRRLRRERQLADQYPGYDDQTPERELDEHTQEIR